MQYVSLHVHTADITPAVSIQCMWGQHNCSCSGTNLVSGVLIYIMTKLLHKCDLVTAAGV